MDRSVNRRFGRTFLDHFENPRNTGTIEGADAAVRVTNPVCGDSLDLYLTVDADRLRRVRYEVVGCPSAVASASCLASRAEGMNRLEAAAISIEDLERELGGLPKTGRHGAALAVEALRKALEQVR